MANKNVTLKDGDNNLYPVTKIDLIEEGGSLFESVKKIALGEPGQLLTVNNNGDGISYTDRLPGSTITDIIAPENDQAVSSSGVYNAINGGFACSTSLNADLASYSSVQITTPYHYINGFTKGSYSFAISDLESGFINRRISFGVHKLTSPTSSAESFELLSSNEDKLYRLKISFDPNDTRGAKIELFTKKYSDLTANWANPEIYTLYYQFVK